MRSIFIRRLSCLAAAVAVLLSLNGCALWDKFFPKGEKAPPQLMADGLRDLEKSRYSAAAEAFQKIKDRYPYSKHAVEAELKLGDALFRQELYDEAFSAYDDFERLHPKHPEVPYVIYQKGMCHFSRVRTIDRDQSHTQKAKEEFERLVKRFPKTEQANRARRQIRECYINLAEHELYIGHFYFRQKKYRAAMERYRYILNNYPDLGQYHEALEYLTRCREKLAREGGLS